jgi:hypothetical protein
MTTGLDYSAGVLTSAQIKAAGHSFVIRYADVPAYLNRKHCRPAEYAELTGGGVAVSLVFEVATTDMLGGAAAGAVNAVRALAAATWLGHPGVVFMACDMHLTAAQIPVALAYIRAAEAVLGHERTGVYGFSELIAAARAAGLGVAYWQCGRDPGAASGVHVWQRNDTSTTVAGIACDVNVLYAPISSGGPAATTTPAASTPATTREDDPVSVPITMHPDGMFRGVVNAEAGSSSQVYADGWLSVTTSWGGARVTVGFHADDGKGNTAVIGQLLLSIMADNQRRTFRVPSGCVKATVEGQVANANAGTEIGAEWIPVRR